MLTVDHNPDQTVGAAPTVCSATWLLERGPAQAALAEAIRAARDGAGATVFVQGAAGLGKTSLLGRAAALAREAGFRVATGVGSRLEARLPFGVFGQALLALGGSAVDDAAELARLGGRPARLYRAYRFLVEAARATPLLLCLDDLHWADADSLELLGFVCRRLAGARLLVLGALRPEPDAASELAAELVSGGHATVAALAPLSRDGAAQLLAALLPVCAPEVERVIDTCAGSPLLLRVAASALRSGASLPTAPGFERSLLLERFVGLGAEAFAFVNAAAILGVRFRLLLAGELAALGEPAWRAAAGQLVRAGLIDDLGGGWAAFVHPLFAQALVESLTAGERELAHARAFRVLVAHGGPDAVAAAHALAGDLGGDRLAIQVAARAGRDALDQGAPAAARDLLGGAVRLSGDQPSVELLLDYAAALTAAGDVQRAQDVCEGLRGRAQVDPGIRAKALALLARAAVVGGRPPEAERLYSEAARLASRRPTIQAQVLADAALSCHVISGMAWVLEMTERALALPAGEQATRRELRTLRAYTRAMAGDPAELDLLERKVRGWLDSGREDDPIWAWTRAVHSLNLFKLLEDPAGATVMFEREFPRALEAGAPMMINALAIAYGDAIHRLGRLREAYELAEKACAVGGLRLTPWYEVAMSATLTELGRERESQPHLEVLREIRARTQPEYYAPVSLWLDLIDARRLLAAGEPRAASDAMLNAAIIAQASGWRHPLLVPWAATGVEAHLAAAAPERARALLADLEALTRPLSCRWPRAVLAIGHAQLAALEGRDTEAERGFAEGLSILEQLPFPIERAEALLRYGHIIWDLALANQGSRTCRLRGYPSVKLLNRRGRASVSARHAHGFAVRTVTLAHGQRAFFTVSLAAAGPCLPRSFTAYGLQVTPPGSHRPQRLHHRPMALCSVARGGHPRVTPVRPRLNG